MAPDLADKPVQAVKIPPPVVDSPAQSEIRIYAHSTILYWWPVWVCGFIMAAVTFLDGSRAAIVPAGSSYDAARHAILLPEGAEHDGGAGSALGERSAQSKVLGLVFTGILLVVIFVTNTPLRGIWSLVAILVVGLLSVTFAWIGAWPGILEVLGQLSIHMNMGFYMYFSSLLFLLWFATVFGFDRTRYWKFRSGQMTREAWFGGGQKSFDTTGMLFENLRDDPFRHWFLGLGSGDLVIKTAGAQPEQVQISNVLFLDSTLSQLQKLVSQDPE